MKASWEILEKNNGLLTVEVDAVQVDEAIDKAFKKAVRTVSVPGFRKGRVPRQIFEARFGVESLYQDAIDIMLPDAYIAALEQTDVEPIGQPDIDIEEFSKGTPLKFTAKIQVKPEVTLGEYKGIEIEEQDLSVSAKEIEDELARVRERQAELIVIEGEPAAEGDIAIIDYEGSVDGVPFEGGKEENHSLELGSGSFIPGFEEQVIGMSKDEERDINITFPEEYHSEELAGKDAVFKVKLNEIKRKSFPDLDDEFAMDVSEFETLDEYKQDIERNIKESKDKANEQYRENRVVEIASEGAEVEVPELMIETELKYMLEEFENRLTSQGMNLEMYYQFSNQDENALREQMRDDAGKRVRESLVLSAIAKAENITASDEEVTEELERLAVIHQQPAEEIREIFTENDNLEGLKKDLVIRNTVKYLIASSVSVPAQIDAETETDAETVEIEADAETAEIEADAETNADHTEEEI